MSALPLRCSLAALLAAAACDGGEEPAPAPPADAARATPAAPAPEPEPASAPSLPALALQVDGAERAEALTGAPFVLTVSLSAAEDAPVARIEDWVARVRLEDPESGERLAWNATPLGAPRAWSFPEGAEPTFEADAHTAVLEAGRIHEVELAVPPEAAARIEPGTHAVRAALEAETGLVFSEPVVVVVRSEAEATPELERARRLATLRFALGAGPADEAERLARELVAAEPAALDAHALLGEALARLGRDAEALEAYRDALALAAPSGRNGEAPELLLERISELEERLGAASSPAP